MPSPNVTQFGNFVVMSHYLVMKGDLKGGDFNGNSKGDFNGEFQEGEPQGGR